MRSIDVSAALAQVAPQCPTFVANYNNRLVTQSVSDCVSAGGVPVGERTYFLRATHTSELVIERADVRLFGPGLASAALTVSFGVSPESTYSLRATNTYCDAPSTTVTPEYNGSTWLDGTLLGYLVLLDEQGAPDDTSAWQTSLLPPSDHQLGPDGVDGQLDLSGLLRRDIDGWATDLALATVQSPTVLSAWEDPPYAGCALAECETEAQWGRPAADGACVMLVEGCLPVGWEICAAPALQIPLDEGMCPD